MDNTLNIGFGAALFNIVNVVEKELGLRVIIIQLAENEMVPQYVRNAEGLLDYAARGLRHNIGIECTGACLNDSGGCLGSLSSVVGELVAVEAVRLWGGAGARARATARSLGAYLLAGEKRLADQVSR